MDRTTLITRGEEEDRRFAQAAGAEGAEAVSETIEDALLKAVPDLAALKGIVTYADIGRMYDITPEQARKWVQRLGVEQVEGPTTHAHYYKWSDIREAVEYCQS